MDRGSYQAMVRSHYAPDADRRDIAREAYEDAVAFIKKELGRDYDKRFAALQEFSTMKDVNAIVQQAEIHYGSLRESKRGVLNFLRRFSNQVMYYGQVLDVLAQHHPEYVALVWGALKFIFTGILNHERLVADFSQALVEIGDALSLTELSTILYQTDDLKEAVSRLYAHILLFFQQALKWYNRSPAGRAIYSIIHPLDYKDTVEQIRSCSKTVNDIANAASRAEIRDFHLTTRLTMSDMQRKLEHMQSVVKETQKAQSRTEEQIKGVLMVATTHKTITERIDINVQDMTPRVRDIQFSQILQTLAPEICPRTTLQKLNSINKRSRSLSIPDSKPSDALRGLKHWFSKSGSSLFILRVGPRAEPKAKEFTANVINLLQSKSINVVWRLSPVAGSFQQHIPSVTEVIQTLIFQVLSLSPSAASKEDDLSVTRFQEFHTETEWVDLLYRLLLGLSNCYVVVETHDLFQTNDGSTRSHARWAANFFKLFSRLVGQASSNGASIKVLVLSYGNTMVPKHDPSLDEANRIYSTLQRPVPTPARLRHKALHRKGPNGWKSLVPKF